MNNSIGSQRAPRERSIRRHLIEGWGGLFLFTCLGIALECLLAFKVPLYVDVESESRRLLWRLAHAHGTLFSLIHLAAAFSFGRFAERAFPQPAGLISGTLTAASLLIPGGFFLAGVDARAGDPGLSIALVPAGAVFLLIAFALAARESFRITHMSTPSGSASAPASPAPDAEN
jgi:hypothetical protein